MTKLIVSVFVTFLFPLIGCSQNLKISEMQKLNLDFEQNENGYPTRWENFGSKDYKIYIDSTIAKNGKNSVVIENNSEISAYKAIAINLPHNYKGKSIQLKGFIKTENVTDGYAGLWIRIDPQVGFDNMNSRGITGTTDWKEYEITLPLIPEKTDKIVLGGLLVGKGKMWIDNLKISIDGKDLNNENLEIYTKVILPADKDKEFDKSSNITFPYLTSETINNLELLGRIWGFLKYNHPEIAKGYYNWDYELFRILPDYLKVKNNQERDNILSNWINKYGNLPICKECKSTSNDAVLKPNLLWIENSNLTTTLKKSLKEIYKNRNQGENYYIKLHPNVGSPDFTNENPYSDMLFPDDGFRLLSVYKYWNMIEYFFPNKHLTDKKWDLVLKEYIPKFINAKNELEYELVALQLIGEINDTHANLWGGGDKIMELRGNNFAPFRAEFVENKYVVVDYYNPEFSERSKLKVGDIITHINNKPVKPILDSLKSYYPSSNEAAMLRDISADLLRSTSNTISLNYISENKKKQHDVPLYDRKQLNMYNWYKVNKDEKCFKILHGNIGYITLANIKEEDIPEIKKSFKSTKGIIIDIRNYPSTFVPFKLGSYFLSEPTQFVKFTQGNPNNPGEFTFTQPLEIPNEKENFEGKLVVLINEKSQSQAEYTAMAFRAAKNSVIIGSTTAGADGNVSTILLPGGLRTMISGIGVYYPDGRETQRIGIVPDIIVTPTIEGIRLGKDEVLNKAIEIINQ
ncbi:S41 family peptidase [Sphingobacterium composti Ten et al. 2007 non Yoo et al. 2007]|uniref:S41 family peptidase n=1 Tax=Sphingobacterium composti TaxID=363260 RepID=UPI001357F1D8|nr:S41 family peptidase [Sphingobacterium composti Ten et al. 2007 non Yoo et al. 2007]